MLYGCVSKILMRYYEIGFIKFGFIGGSKFKVFLMLIENRREDENLKINFIFIILLI